MMTRRRFFFGRFFGVSQNARTPSMFAPRTATPYFSGQSAMRFSIMTVAASTISCQASAEAGTFSREELNLTLNTAEDAIRRLIEIQEKALGKHPV